MTELKVIPLGEPDLWVPRIFATYSEAEHYAMTGEGQGDRDCWCLYTGGRLTPLADGTVEVAAIVRTTTMGCPVHTRLERLVRHPRWALWRRKQWERVPVEEAVRMLYGGGKL